MAKTLAQASLDPMTCSTSVTTVMSSRFIIKPATVQAKFTRNCSPSPLRLSEGPRFQLGIDVGRVAVVVLEEQYDTLHKMVDHLRLYSKGMQYRKWRPVAKDRNRCTVYCVYAYFVVCIVLCCVNQLRQPTNRKAVDLIPGVATLVLLLFP